MALATKTKTNTVTVKFARKKLLAIAKASASQSLASSEMANFLKLQVVQNTCKITAYDYSVFTSVETECESNNDLELLVLTADLVKILGLLSTEYVILSFAFNDENKIAGSIQSEGKGGRSKYSIQAKSIDPDNDFIPPVQPNQISSNHELDVLQFMEGISRVIHASSDDESKGVLKSIQVASSECDLQFRATDGYKASICRFQLATASNFEFLLAKSSAAQIRLLLALESASNSMKLGVSDDSNFLSIECGGITIVAVALNSRYPELAKLYPPDSNFVLRLKFDSKILIDSLARLISMGDKKAPCAAFKIEGESCEITMRSGEQIHVEEISCSWNSLNDAAIESPHIIGYNLTYLKDSAISVATDTLQILVTSPLSPSILVSEDSSTDVKALVMPVQIRTDV